MYPRAVRWPGPTLAAAVITACGAIDPAASGGNSNPSIPPCTSPAIAACDPNGANPCFPTWPTDLAKYCAKVTPGTGFSVSHGKCAGYDMVVSTQTADRVLIYLYGADGALVAIVAMGELAWQCIGGPKPLVFPGICNANPSTPASAGCCSSVDTTVNCP